MAASTLVARSQRCHGVSAALAERLRTSNSPTGSIQASHRDPSDTYDLEMVASLRSRISAHGSEPNDNDLGSRRYPPFAQSSAPQYCKKCRPTQIGPSRIVLLCECGKRSSCDRPVAGIGSTTIGRSEALLLPQGAAAGEATLGVSGRKGVLPPESATPASTPSIADADKFVLT
jgi:hypothetical protein